MEVTDHKRIAMRYIKGGWLIFDILSIIPLDHILSAGSGSSSDGGAEASDVNSLLRFAKFSKVYKIVRLTRLAKVFKVLKKNKTLLSKMTEKLRINNGFERLAIFVSFFALFIHVAACMFVLLANFEKDYTTTWVEIWEPKNNGHCYVMAAYFVMTTVSTVGYGDIIPGTTWERVFCVLLMFVGVSAFTFVSGALSSIISNYD